MNRMTALLSLAALFLGTVSCGYFQAGSWEDDPENWYRAFGVAKPDEVDLIHSLYTRYPHWTHEHSFYLTCPQFLYQLSC
jgi:hypothetical protein